MQHDLFVSVALLVALFLAGAVILRIDQRNRHMQQQADLVTSLIDHGASQEAIRSIRKEKQRFQSLRTIGRYLLRYDPNFAEAYSLPVPVTFMAAGGAGLAIGILAVSAIPVLPGVLAGAFAACCAARFLFAWQRERYTDSLRRQLPDALQFAASAIRAGFPVLEAFRGITREAPAPTRGQFEDVMYEIALGRPVHEVLLNLYYRTQVAEYAIFAVTLAVQTKTGGHLAETIETLAQTVRDRITIAARAKALAGEGTVSATILSILPVVTGIALSLIQPGYLEPLFSDPRGRRLFMMSVALLLAGIWTMHRMIRGVVQE